MPLPTIVEHTEAFETWLRQQCTVVEAGLKKKHKRMAKDAFMFFRATCYRFAQQLPLQLPYPGAGPGVPSVGDAHIENWGTWRDAEGRLIWGVNDFDEAAILPYTYDLVRLATSARLAKKLQIGQGDAIDAILGGYRDGLDKPRPFVVGAADWFEGLLYDLHDKASSFDDELDKAEDAKQDVPAVVAELLTALLPNQTEEIDIRKWQKGGGSLGRPRFLAIGLWRGGKVLREAKALVPSAWNMSSGNGGSLFMAMARGRYRAPDPFLEVRPGYIVRRIAFDSHKIDLTDGRAAKYNEKLLQKMGADLAAIHLSGDQGRQQILDDLTARDPDWLHDAAKTAEHAVKEDHEIWKAYYEATKA
jgi:hypothetical protein